MQPASEAPAFSSSERVWMNQKRVVRYSIDPSWAPIEYVRGGIPEGLVVQYIRHFEKVMPLRFEYVPTTDWRDAVRAFEAGELDVVTGSSLRSSDPTLSPVGLASVPYYAGNTIVAALPDHRVVLELDQLTGLRVAIGRYEAAGNWLVENVPRLIVKEYDTPVDMFDAVIRGEVDVAVAPELVLLPLMLRSYSGRVAVAGTLAEVPVVQRLIVPDLQPQLKSVLDKALLSMSAGDTDRLLAHWIERSDFGRPPVRAVFVYYRTEIALGVVLVLFLLTTLALMWRLRQTAQRSAERKMAFLAVVSHEIRTAMNALTGPLELLGRQPDRVQRDTLLRVAQDGARVLVDTVNDYLDLSTLEARKAVAQATPTDVLGLADEVVRSLLYSVSSGVHMGHEVKVPGILLLDAGKYRQVLSNLLTNAIKFTPMGRISLEVRWRDGRLHTDVRDTGIGMTPAQARVAFDAYAHGPHALDSRVGATDNAGGERQGTGLGLAICKALVELMGGNLSVQTQRGAGTTMTFDVLAREWVNTADSPVESTGGLPDAVQWNIEQAPPPHARGHVLAVDDNGVNLLVLRQQFEALEWPLTTCSSGREALALWASGQFALLLLDCHMPDVNGYDVARNIRTEQAGRREPRAALVAVSAHVDPVHAARCRASGMDDVLIKPLRLADLQTILLRFAVRPARMGSEGHGVSDHAIRAAMREANEADGAAMRQACAQRDAGNLARLAHRVHGAALVVGARELAQATLDLETQARGIPLDWARLDRTMTAVLAAIDDYAQSSALNDEARTPPTDA